MRAEFQELFTAIQQQQSSSVIEARLARLFEKYPFNPKNPNTRSFLGFLKGNAWDFIHCLLDYGYENAAIQCTEEANKHQSLFELEDINPLQKTATDVDSINYLKIVKPELTQAEAEKIQQKNRLKHFAAVLEKEDLVGTRDAVMAYAPNNLGLDELSSHLKTYRFFNELCTQGLIGDPLVFLGTNIDKLQESFLIDVFENNESLKKDLLSCHFEETWNSLPVTLSFLQWCVLKNKKSLVQHFASSLPLEPTFTAFEKQKSSVCLINTKKILYTLIDTHLVSKEEIKIHRNSMINYNVSYDYIDKFDSYVLHFIDSVIEMSDGEPCQFDPRWLTGAIFEKLIALSCPSLFHFILKTYAENFTQENIQRALKSALRLGRLDYFRDIITTCNISSAMITASLIDTLEAGDPDFTEAILANYPVRSKTEKLDFEEMFGFVDINDIDLKKSVLLSNNPKAALLFLREGMTLSDISILKLIEFAAIKGDGESLRVLEKYLVKKVDLSHLKIYSKNPLDPVPEEDRIYFAGVYYSGQKPFPQEKFLAAMSDISDTLLYAFVHDLLDFSDVSSTVIDDTRENLTCAKIGFARKQLAERSLTPNCEKFGVLRNSLVLHTTTTPLLASSRYWTFHPPVADESFREKYEEKGFFVRTGDDHFQEGLFFPQGTVIGYINGEPIELTEYTTYYSETNFGVIAWRHTNANNNTNIQRCANHIAELIQHVKRFDLTQYPETRAELIRHIGLIYWWLAHATLFERGSASITDAFIKALFKYHHLDARWTGMGDCLALSTPDENEFCDIYAEKLSLKLLDITVSSPSPMPKTAASLATEASAPAPNLAKHIQFFNKPLPAEGLPKFQGAPEPCI